MTEDILEAVHENNAQARLAFRWQSQIGMQGLVGQSALERALFCITKHNSILEVEVEGEVVHAESQRKEMKKEVEKTTEGRSVVSR